MAKPRMCWRWSMLPPRTPPHFPPSSSLQFSPFFHPSLLGLIFAPPVFLPQPQKVRVRGTEQSYAVPGCVAARAITIYVVVAPRPARDLQRVAESGYMGNKGKAAKTSRERGPSRALPCFFGGVPKAPRGLHEGFRGPSCPSGVDFERPNRAPRGLHDGLRRAPNGTYQPCGLSQCFKRAPGGPQEGPNFKTHKRFESIL